MSPLRLAALLPALACASAALLILLLHADVALFLPLRAALLAMGPALTVPFWSACTLLGDALVAPLLVLPFLPRRPTLLWESLLAAVVATVVTHGVKPWLNLPRPPAVLDLTVIGPRLLAGSFPSGHTTTAFTVFALLLLAGCLLRPWHWLVALLLALLVGASRIAVGAHWPSDVLGGAAAGWLSAWLALRLAARWPLARRGVLARGLPVLVGLMAIVDLFGHDTGYPAGIFLQQAVAALMLGALVLQHFRAGRQGTA